VEFFYCDGGLDADAANQTIFANLLIAIMRPKIDCACVAITTSVVTEVRFRACPNFCVNGISVHI